MYSLVFCIAFAGQCAPQTFTYPTKEECESQQRKLVLQLKSQRKDYNYVLCKPGK